MNCKPFYLIFLSMFVTCFSVFALGAWGEFAKPEAPKVPNRKILFVEAFRQLPFAVSFAVESPEFLSQLTPEETRQILGVHSITEGIKNEIQWGEALKKIGAERTKLPELVFSESSADFQLNPGEKPRLAKTTEIFSDPVVVNLLYLNSPSISPKYIRVLQTLFHEFGHKVLIGKDQKALDSVAAKFVQFLEPYYHFVEQVDPQQHYGKVRVEILSLPITFKPSRTDIPDLPGVLVTAADQVAYHKLLLEDVAGPLKRFTESFESNSFIRIQEELSVRISNLRLIALPGFYADIKTNIEVQTGLYMEGPSYTPAGVFGLPGANYQYMNMQSHVALALPTEIINIDTLWRIPKPRPKDGMWQQSIMPLHREWDYQGKTLENRVLSVNQTPQEIRLAMMAGEDILTTQLRLQDEDASLLLEGKLISKAGAKSQWQFSIPNNISSKSGQVKIRDVIVNSQSRSLLPEVLTLQTSTNLTESLFSLSAVTFFNGKEWVPYEKILALPPGAARMRIVIEGSDDVNKIYLRWNSGASLIIAKDTANAGVWGSVHEEIIKDFKLVEDSGGLRTYEFVSRGILKTVFPNVAEGLRTEDSGRRFLKELHAVNLKMQSASQVFTNYLMIFNKEYIGVKSRAGIVRCQGVFL